MSFQLKKNIVPIEKSIVPIEKSVNSIEKVNENVILLQKSGKKYNSRVFAFDEALCPEHTTTVLVTFKGYETSNTQDDERLHSF